MKWIDFGRIVVLLTCMAMSFCFGYTYRGDQIYSAMVQGIVPIKGGLK